MLTKIRDYKKVPVVSYFN